MSDNPPAQTNHGNGRNLQPTLTTMKRTHWEVQYARFFTFPLPPSHNSPTTCSSLRPLFPRTKRRLKGTWVPSKSSNISLRFLSHSSSLSEPTIVVSHQETIYEEHYVSTLHFTWPQVSCVSGAVRGSRVILASYRDSTRQIQKFAMRFSCSAESEAFMESVKCLKDAKTVDCLSNLTSSLYHQSIDSESNHMNPSVECTTLRQPSIKQEHVTYSCSQPAMLSHAAESADATLPPSFTTLLSECCAETDPGISQAPLENDLNNFLKMGSMADYSFIDMLDKMDTVITCLGGDLAF